MADTATLSPDDVQKQMQTNSDAWNNTTDPNEQARLHQANLDLAKQSGGSESNYNAEQGTWNFPGTSNTTSATATPTTAPVTPQDTSAALPTAYRTPQGQTVSNEGNAHINVGGSQVDVPIHQGSSYAPLSTLEQITGQKATKDPNTGSITLGGKQFQPVGYDASGNPMLGVRNTLETLGGYKLDWNQDNQNISVYKDQTQQQQSNPNLGNMFQNMPQMPQMQPYQAPDLSNYMNNMMPYTQFNPNYQSYNDQAKAQIDPLYQSQYKQLADKQATDINQMNESMNRRGIYTSGVAQAAENDLRAKTTGAVSGLFGKEMSEIQKNAQQLFQNAYKQYSDGNQFALKNNQFMMTQMMNERKTSFDQWLRTQNLSMQQYQYAMNAWDKMANLIQKDNFHQDDMNWKDTTFNNLSAQQEAALHQQYDKMNQDWQKTLLPYQDTTQYQKGQLDQGQQKIDLQNAAQEAANYFKQRGIDINVAKLEEAIRHNQTGESLQSQKLTTDTAMNQQKLQEKVWYDQQMVDKASTQALTAAKKVQLDDYKAQLSSLSQQLVQYAANQKQPPADIVTKYNDVMNKIDGVIGGGGNGG